MNRVFYIGESTTGPSEHFIGTPRRECGAIGGQALFRAASQERTEPVKGMSGSSYGEEGENNYPVSSLVEVTGLRGGTVQHALSFVGENQKAGSLGPPHPARHVSESHVIVSSLSQELSSCPAGGAGEISNNLEEASTRQSPSSRDNNEESQQA